MADVEEADHMPVEGEAEQEVGIGGKRQSGVGGVTDGGRTSKSSKTGPEEDSSSEGPRAVLVRRDQRLAASPTSGQEDGESGEPSPSKEYSYSYSQEEDEEEEVAPTGAGGEVGTPTGQGVTTGSEGVRLERRAFTRVLAGRVAFKAAAVANNVDG